MNGQMSEKDAADFMIKVNRQHADWLAKPLTRSEWLDLLMRCQNGEATCLYVLEKIEAEQSLISQSDMFDALGIALTKIEAAGASVSLTEAVIIVGNIRSAIGNQRNPPKPEYAAMIRATLAEAKGETAAKPTKPNEP